jgi:hypothetical protein
MAIESAKLQLIDRLIEATQAQAKAREVLAAAQSIPSRRRCRRKLRMAERSVRSALHEAVRLRIAV